MLSDSAGTPGAILASFTLSVPPGPPSPFPLLSIPAGPGLIVVAGQHYWFEVTGGASTLAIWTQNLFQGNSIDGGASQTVSSGIPQSWVVGTGALQILGDPIP